MVVNGKPLSSALFGFTESWIYILAIAVSIIAACIVEHDKFDGWKALYVIIALWIAIFAAFARSDAGFESERFATNLASNYVHLSFYVLIVLGLAVILPDKVRQTLDSWKAAGVI